MRIDIQQRPSRFFAMNDAGPMPLRHGEYGEQVQDYFHKLFPHREWKVFSDMTASPIPIGVEMLYPTVEEPFYLLHTIGMSAVPMQMCIRDRGYLVSVAAILPVNSSRLGTAYSKVMAVCCT